MVDFLPFIIFLMILAVFLRAESALTVLYLMIGVLALGMWWNRRAIRHIEITRDFIDHAYLNDDIHLKLTVKNTSILPILWLEIHESLPVNLRAGRTVDEVVSLGIREKKTIHYQLNAFKRGYYLIGPLLINSGDPLGLIQPAQIEFPSQALTVYPQIVTLDALGLPSRSPFGTIKHDNPVYEDPSRLMGKRDFQYGDSIRKIDWKSTASAGHLLVKLYEASIALEVVTILDLDKESYEIKSFYDATELSIIAAASIAAWAKTHKQSIGLMTNGSDPLQEGNMPQPLLPKKGSDHYVDILEILARIEPGNTLSVDTLIQNAFASLSWGTTIVFISGKVNTTILTQLLNARKKGLNPVMVFTGRNPDFPELKNLARHYHIDLFSATYPQDLKTMKAEP